MEKLKKYFTEYSEYFEVIRKKIFRLGIVFFVFFVVGFIEAGNIVKVIIHFFRLQNVNIVTTSPFQFIDLSTKIGLGVGILVVLPLLIYYIYTFLKDGLTRREKKWFFVFLLAGLILFVVGFLYCFAILYFYLNTVSRIGLLFGINNVWDVNSFLSQILTASVVFGLVFQFPIFLTFLIRIGVVKVEYLRRKSRVIIAIIFIFVGFLPPPDIFSTILEAAPLVILYGLTIWLNSILPPNIKMMTEIPKEGDIIEVKT